jgi:hypothetical protein
MIKVDYERLTVEGDMTARFKSKDEMFKAVFKFVISEGKSIPRSTCKKSRENPTGINDNRPYIFKGQTT